MGFRSALNEATKDSLTRAGLHTKVRRSIPLFQALWPAVAGASSAGQRGIKTPPAIAGGETLISVAEGSCYVCQWFSEFQSLFFAVPLFLRFPGHLRLARAAMPGAGDRGPGSGYLHGNREYGRLQWHAHYADRDRFALPGQRDGLQLFAA